MNQTRFAYVQIGANDYKALADFYEEKGYFVNSPSRSYRYQVLLDFATAVDSEREKLYKEALTFDLYLRENMKTRPEFARDLSEHKDWCRLFYEKEEDKRISCSHLYYTDCFINCYICLV